MGVLSIIILFWSASSLFSSISLAINRTLEIRRSRSFLIAKAGDLGMALSIGVLFLLSLGSSALISVLGGVFGLR